MSAAPSTIPISTPSPSRRMPDPEDSSRLLARLRDGEESAYDELVRQHGARMLAAISSILHHRQDAEDALQEAFLQAFRSLPRFRGEASLGTWLYRIAVNAALMRLRSSRRRPEVSVDDLLPLFDETGHRVLDRNPVWTAVDEEAGRAEIRQRIHLAISRLPRNYREIVLLRDLEERSTSETARLLGITETAVKLRLHRARQALAALLDVERRPLRRKSDSEPRRPGSALPA